MWSSERWNHFEDRNETSVLAIANSTPCSYEVIREEERQKEKKERKKQTKKRDLFVDLFLLIGPCDWQRRTRLQRTGTRHSVQRLLAAVQSGMSAHHRKH